MLKKLKYWLKMKVLNFGYKTNEKYIIFESDDWGAIRSNSDGIVALQKKYPEFKLNVYQKNDCLESKEDLEQLFEVLKKYTDINGNHPVFTANYIMSNVNFIDPTEDIKFMSIKEIYQRKKLLDIINKNKEVFYPQLHGFYHFNLEQLKKELGCNEIVKFAFEHKIIGVGSGHYQGMDTFRNMSTIGDIEKSQKLFEDCFGYKSKSFIFPCYVWSNSNEKELSSCNVKYIQGGVKQFVPRRVKFKKKINYMGKINKFGQIYLIRNCQFEPSKYIDENKQIELCKKDCLNQIDMCFKMKKPAIICTHRVNYVGGINEKNRDDNLRLLDDLLNQITRKYPDVQFITSERLGEIIEGKECK